MMGSFERLVVMLHGISFVYYRLGGVEGISSSWLFGIARFARRLSEQLGSVGLLDLLLIPATLGAWLLVAVFKRKRYPICLNSGTL